MSGMKNFAYLTMDKFPTTAEVDMFPLTYGSNFIATTHVESVVLLMRKDK